MNNLPEMTEAQRMQEIAQLLATAIERAHKKQQKVSGKTSEKLPNNSLDYGCEESVYA
ncbi:MAG: hypothetical protein ABL857_00030 [Rickettsiales bacterium]